MALPDLSVLARHAATGFAPRYLVDSPTFYAPGDDLHGVLCDVLKSAQHSLVVAMYGFTDPELAQIISDHLDNLDVYVQLSLDSSQAGGTAEKAMLAKCDLLANSIAVGRSRKGGILHLKLAIVDGLDVIGGSTNWSGSGERLQDNQLSVVRDAIGAARARKELDIVHDSLLQQMAAKRAKAA